MAGFAAACQVCCAETRWIELSPTVVEGSLRLDADVGFIACRRGHRIRVRRVARSMPLTAA